MGVNHVKGTGCKRRDCWHKHVCLLCGDPDHGLWSTSADGTFVCNEHQMYVDQQEEADLDDYEIRSIIQGSIDTEPFVSAEEFDVSIVHDSDVTSSSVDTKRLSKASAERKLDIRKNYPVLARVQERLMRADKKAMAETAAHWEKHKIEQPGFVKQLYALNKHSKRICMRHNHTFGAGCKLPSCRYDHICLMCGTKGHGLWHTRIDGTFQCKEHRMYVEEQKQACLTDVEIVESLQRLKHSDKRVTFA